MRKIINGKLYDTDTAALISSYSYGNSGDLSYTYEALYQKKTGELFLYGEGGAMTCYSNPCGDNSWSGGEAIMPAGQFNVKDWVAEHCDTDTYIKLFGMSLSNQPDAPGKCPSCAAPTIITIF